MICFKRNILIVLMIIEHFMLFNHVMAPNKGFKKCYKQLENAFLLFGNENSPLYCIKNAIMYLSENDDLKSDLRGYYKQFPGQVNGDKIMNRKAFCDEITNSISDDAAKNDPAEYIYQQLLAQTTEDLVSPSMYLFKLSKDETSKDKDEEIEKCVEELVVFGSPFASNEDILDLAIRYYRISFSNEKLDHTFDSKSYGCQYLIHISEVVTLKRHSTLITPWDYCRDIHPDKEQNPKSKDQASSSKQKTKYKLRII